MGEQRNLTEENVDELREHLERMQKDNQDLEYTFFKQNEGSNSDAEDIITIVEEIRENVNAIKRKLDLVFDDYILIDGIFRKP